MENSNVAKGTMQIASVNAAEYMVMALFYIFVTKTGTLTQTDLGVLSILTFLTTTFSDLTRLALPTALTKFASENLGKNQLEEAAAIQKTVTRTMLVLSIIGLVIMAIVSGPLSQYFWITPTYAPIIILMATYGSLFNLILLYKSGLQALRLFGKMATITLIFSISSRTIAAILALLHLGVLGVSIGYISGAVIALSAAIIFFYHRLPRPNDNAPLRPILHFSLPLFFSQIVILVLHWADTVILASMTSNYALVGIYYIVVRSIQVLSIIWIPITVTIFPVLSARYGLHDPKSIGNILRDSSRYLLYMLFPVCLGLALIAPTALTLFYGPSYTPGATPLAILSIASIILALYSLFTATIIAIGKTKDVLKIDTVSALLSIALLIVLVPFLEATGAALTRLIVQMISLMLAIYVLRRHIKVQLDKEAAWKSFVASTATIPFLIALESTLCAKIPAIQVFTIEILVAACIYLFSLYILKALNSQDFKLLRQASPRFLSKYISLLEKILVH